MKRYKSRWHTHQKNEPAFDIQNELFKINLNATVLLVEKSRLVKNKSGGYDITDGTSLRESMFLCPSDPQSQEKPLGVCTGLIMFFYWVVLPTTCLDKDNKNEFVLVKNFKQGATTLLASDVISLDDVILKNPSNKTMTILELPKYDLSSYIVIDQLGDPVVDAGVYIIGYPFGLPQAFTFGRVRTLDSADTFTIEASGFGLAPGSPVFDMNTHLLVGILSSGIKKYQYNLQQQCFDSLEQTNMQKVIGLSVFLPELLDYLDQNVVINGQTIPQISRVQEAARLFSKQ